MPRKGTREEVQAAHKHWRRKYPIRAMLRNARKRGMEHNLEEADFVLPSHCPVLGIPIELGTRLSKDGSPTLDRIDTSQGYLKDNVAIISWRANRLKSDATFEEIEAIYFYMKRHRDERRMARTMRKTKLSKG